MFRSMTASVSNMLADDSGQGLVEYALTISLVALVALAAMRVLGRKVSNTLSNAAGSM